MSIIGVKGGHGVVVPTTADDWPVRLEATSGGGLCIAGSHPYLTRETLAELVPVLQRYLDTGRLEPGEEKVGEPTVVVTVDVAEAREKRMHDRNLWTLNENGTDWGPTIAVEGPWQKTLAV